MKTIAVKLLLVFTIILSGCEKNNEVEPVIPSAPNNNNNNNGNSQDESYFIEFKLDSELVRLDYIPATLNNFSNCLVSFHVDTTYFYTLHQIATTINNYFDGGLSQILFNFKDSVPLEVKSYHFTQVSSHFKPLFIYQISGLANSYVISIHSECSIEFTRIDTVEGGRVEGTFSFTEIELRDDNSNLISSHHTITDGKFSYPVE